MALVSVAAASTPAPVCNHFLFTMVLLLKVRLASHYWDGTYSISHILDRSQLRGGDCSNWLGQGSVHSYGWRIRWRPSEQRQSVFCQLLAEMFFNAVVGQENVCTPATSHWASSQASPSVEATVVVSGETRSVDTISVSVIPSWLTVTDTV